jgi:hypothetical protein
MAIAAEPLLPSGSLFAVDWVAISIAAALETRVNASAGIASATVAVAVTNNNIAATTSDNENNDNNDVWIHPAP